MLELAVYIITSIQGTQNNPSKPADTHSFLPWHLLQYLERGRDCLSKQIGQKMCSFH